MSDGPEDEENWFRPVWETEDEVALDPPGRLCPRKQAAEPDYRYPLLTPLARAQDAVARPEAKAEMALPVVVEGLRARLSYLEVAGWLCYAHMWLHPLNLVLRDMGAVASHGAAARGDRLATVLPATMVQHTDLDHVVETSAVGLDTAANLAIDLARMWRRLGELRTWQPLADAEAVHKTPQSLGFRCAEHDMIEDWLTDLSERDHGPDLIRAGRTAVDWICQLSVRDKDPDGVFLGVCLWCVKPQRADPPALLVGARAPSSPARFADRPQLDRTISRMRHGGGADWPVRAGTTARG